LSTQPSRFNAASNRAALAMAPTVEHDTVSTGLPGHFRRIPAHKVPAACRDICCSPRQAHSRVMMQHELAPVPAHGWHATGPLDRAVAAYLTRFTGSCREHARSDLRCFLAWCADPNLHPLGPIGRTWSCTSDGCRRSGASSHRRSHADFGGRELLP